MQELFGAFRDILDRFDGNDRVLSAFVFSAWRKTVGQQLRDRTEPIEFQRKRLTIAVENESWKRHLRDLSGEIIYKLNAALGQGVVTFLEFTIDPAEAGYVHNDNQARLQEDDLLVAVDSSLSEAANGISNPALREKFLRAAAASLARRDR